MAVGPDGSVYAGSDGEGLIYRVGPDGKATILFDAPQSEIRTLLVAADGTLYAGTAAEAGGSSSGRATRCSSRERDASTSPGDPGADRASVMPA